MSHYKFPLFQAHRGYWADGAIENSLDSFYSAHKKGFEMIELDVRLSLDRIPFVFHDEYVTINNSLEKIEQLNLVEIKKIFPHIPTLEEVITFSQRPLFINIELKTQHPFCSKLERQVANLVKKYHIQKYVLFSSFNPFSLWRMSTLLNECPRALLMEHENERLLYTPFKKTHFIKLSRAQYIHIQLNCFSTYFFNYWTQKKIQIGIWTLKKPEEFKKNYDPRVYSWIIDFNLQNLKI